MEVLRILRKLQLSSCYAFYSIHNYIKKPINNDIEVHEGGEFIETKESRTIIRITDIELANAEAVSTYESGEVLQKIGIGYQSRMEMAHARVYKDMSENCVDFLISNRQ